MRITEEEARREFAKHVATRSAAVSHLGPIDVLEWAQPGHSNFRIVYTLRNSVLHVDGDLGAACYQWYGKTSLDAIAGYSLSYFREKCRASEYNDYGQEWSRDAAIENLQYRIDQAIAEFEDEGGSPVKCTAEQFAEHHGSSEDLDNEFLWGKLLYEADYQKMLIPGTEHLNNGEGIHLCLEESWHIGMVTGRRIEWHLWGLRLAMEKLKCPEAADGGRCE